MMICLTQKRECVLYGAVRVHRRVQSNANAAPCYLRGYPYVLALVTAAPVAAYVRLRSPAKVQLLLRQLVAPVFRSHRGESVVEPSTRRRRKVRVLLSIGLSWRREH